MIKLLNKKDPVQQDVHPYTIDIEESGRRKLFTIFLVLLLLPLISLGITLIRDGLYRYGVIDCILAAVFLIFIYILRTVKNARYMYRTVEILLVILLFYWVNTGAIRGYASIWVLTYPPFSFFLLGKREGFFWTILVSVMTAVLFLFPSLSLTGFTYENDFITRHLFALFLIILFTYYYESVREVFKKAMESEQSKLIKQQNMLEQLVSERTLQLNDKIHELESGEKRYRLFADNVNDLIWSVDRGLRFTYISPSVTRMYGYSVEEAMNLPHEKWNTPESYKRLIKAIDDQFELDKQGADPGRFTLVLLEHFKKDGSIINVELKASLIRDEAGKIAGFAGVSRDITERIKSDRDKDKIQEQLVQAQKMEAVGTLAGGLAHDFNNFLGGIMGSFELIQKITEKEIPGSSAILDKYLKIGMESSKKSADLIRQLLALSRKHEIRLMPVDIRSALDHVSELCRNSLPKSVELECINTCFPVYIMGEPAQIEQVILNLSINASHSMTIMRPAGEKQGGTLSIALDIIEPDNLPQEYFPEYNDSSSWSRIRISDTGVGMNDETKKRIFEPFYSTKKKNDGTGLGLAITYNIIRKHGGFINVYSEPGKGSCFTVYLPVCSEEFVLPQGESSAGIEQGSGTILVIDDELFILNIARGFLEHCGYDVIISEGAAEGIETYRLHNNLISAVLIDYSMPGKTGLEVFNELKKINSNVMALLSSGMLDNETKEAALNMGIIDTVSKPYTTFELSVKIKKIVSG